MNNLSTSQWGGFINGIVLASSPAVKLHSGLYWLGTQTGSYRCCPASQRAVTFSIALTEEQEICRKSTGAQWAIEVGLDCITNYGRGSTSTPTPPCTLNKDASKWFPLSTMWDNNTSPWVVIGMLCWKQTCGTWLIRFCEWISQLTSFMELRSTFPQRILFRLRVHSWVNTVTSKLFEGPPLPKWLLPPCWEQMLYYYCCCCWWQCWCSYTTVFAHWIKSVSNPLAFVPT